MKISDIITETTAGAVATVAVPLGGMRKRPNPSVFANTSKGKKKKVEDVSPDEEDKFHNELDDLVHSYFGDSPDEEKEKKNKKHKHESS